MLFSGGESWLAGHSPRLRAMLAFALGLAMALGHAPFGFPWTWLLAFPLLLILLRLAPRPRAAAVIAWCAGLGYFALSLTWIVEPFLVDIARHGWMAPFALLFLSAGLALFWGAAGWLAARAPLSVTAAFPLALALAELARARILTGFPWAHPAYVWVDTPLAQIAAWIGPHGLALAIFLCLAALTARSWRGPVAGLAGLGLLAGLGALDAWELPKGDPSAPVARIVQPNAAQRLKWRPDMAQEFYERLLELTAAPGARPPDMVIWPETAVTFLLHDRPDLQADILLAAGGEVPVILGIRHYDDTRGWFNSLAVLGQGGEVLARYDKHHLVPFGEYFPFVDTLSALGLGPLVSGLAGRFQPGEGPRTLAIDGLPAFQPLICYEVIFPHEMTGRPRPEFLLQITNDAWFGRFSGPYQHLAQARMRAIEQGLPLLRAANTGVSAAIDARGRVLDMLPLGQAGFIDVPLPNPRAATPYARFGDWGFVVLLLASASVLSLTHRRP